MKGNGKLNNEEKQNKKIEFGELYLQTKMNSNG